MKPKPQSSSGQFAKGWKSPLSNCGAEDLKFDARSPENNRILSGAFSKHALGSICGTAAGTHWAGFVKQRSIIKCVFMFEVLPSELIHACLTPFYGKLANGLGVSVSTISTC